MTNATQTDTVLNIVQTQQLSLDDTDCYASAWADALAHYTNASESSSLPSTLWGGRGKGGRGLARRTIQPHDIVVDNVWLHYLASETCLEGATLKLLHGHVYALIGRNGCGKSSLLRRIHAGKIPGLSPHFSTLYIPQEITIERDRMNPLQVVLGYHDSYIQNSTQAAQVRIQELEAELETLQVDNESEQQQVEQICEEISSLEEQMEDEYSIQIIQQQAQDALRLFGIDQVDAPCKELSAGQLKKITLAAALFCPCDLLLLDEPNQLDISGLLQLRRLIAICQERKTTVLLVSHDADLINDVATDIIYFANKELYYYPGNYENFKVIQQQQNIHELRQNVALEKKREQMLTTLDNLKKQAVPKRGGAQKKARAIESHKKKLERQGITKDEKGHRWTQQKAGTGIQKGSINALDASARKGLSTSQLLKQAEKSIQSAPDKAVQFM